MVSFLFVCVYVLLYTIPCIVCVLDFPQIGFVFCLAPNCEIWLIWDHLDSSGATLEQPAWDQHETSMPAWDQHETSMPAWGQHARMRPAWDQHETNMRESSGRASGRGSGGHGEGLEGRLGQTYADLSCHPPRTPFLRLRFPTNRNRVCLAPNESNQIKYRCFGVIYHGVRGGAPP